MDIQRYQPPNQSICEQLEALGETPSTPQTLEETGLQPYFDIVYAQLKSIDRWLAQSLSVDWITAFSDSGRPGAAVYFFKPAPVIVLRVGTLQHFLMDEYRKVKEFGPIKIGDKALSVQSTNAIFAEWLYLHEVVHIINGHAAYKAAYGTDALTNRALERDADLRATKISYQRYSAAFGATMSDIEIRTLMFCAQLNVMWWLIEYQPQQHVSHPSWEERIAWSLAECATVGRTRDGEIVAGLMSDVERDTKSLMGTMVEMEKRFVRGGGTAENRKRFKRTMLSLPHDVINRWTEIEPEVRNFWYIRSC